MSSCGSDVSLHDLPLPYDISNAVSRALRLDSASGTELTVPRSACPLNSPPGYNGWKDSKAASPGFCAVSHTCSYVDEYALETIKIDMAVRQMQANDPNYMEPHVNDLDRLDELCQYIDDEEEGLAFAPSGHRPYSVSESTPVPVRASARPKPKRRRTDECDSSPEVSPQRYSPPAGQFDPVGSAQRYNWKVSLANLELWEKFDEIGTEMVITKNGRRMFPAITVRIKGLEPDSIYSIALDIIPSDNKRYKFMGTEWVPVGRAEKKQVYREYNHPDSPNVGSVWMEQPLQFKFVKLTNNKNTRYDEQVILNSMQKYQPFIRITSEQDGVTQSYSFPETQFIAVTAYQNSKITQLKVDNNPYARAFREGNDDTETCGGHYANKRASTSSAGSTENTPKRVRQAKMADKKPRRASVNNHRLVSQLSTSEPNCTNPTSIESGFESGEGSAPEIFIAESQPVYVDDMSLLPLPEPAYALGCWPDTTLYNPVLLNPPPLLDSSSSFSEPYLQESCRIAMETSQFSPSPLKGFQYSDFDTSMDDTLVIDVVHCPEDDDVFL